MAESAGRLVEGMEGEASLQNGIAAWLDAHR